MGRVRSLFDPVGLSDATGWGAKLPSERMAPPRWMAKSLSLAKSAGGTLPIALCGSHGAVVESRPRTREKRYEQYLVQQLIAQAAVEVFD
jgi:hypothetical protein